MSLNFPKEKMNNKKYYSESELPDLKLQFEKSGYIINEDILPIEKCDIIKKKIRILEREKKLKQVNLKSSKFKTINGIDLFQNIPEVEQLYNEFLKIATTISGKNLRKLKNTKIGASINITGIGGNFQYHYDRNYITVVLYINEVDGGKMLAVPRYRIFNKTIVESSNRIKQFIETLNTKFANYSKKKIEIQPKPGKVFIFEGRQTLHSVTKVNSGEPRISIQFAYDSNEDLFNENNTTDYYGN